MFVSCFRIDRHNSWAYFSSHQAAKARGILSRESYFQQLVHKREINADRGRYVQDAAVVFVHNAIKQAKPGKLENAVRKAG